MSSGRQLVAAFCTELEKMAALSAMPTTTAGKAPQVAVVPGTSKGKAVSPPQNVKMPKPGQVGKPQ